MTSSEYQELAISRYGVFTPLATDASGIRWLDLMMPERMGGKPSGKLRRLRPDVRVVICSGYDRDRLDHLFPYPTGRLGIIQKPFEIAEFSGKVTRILDRAQRFEDTLLGPAQRPTANLSLKRSSSSPWENGFSCPVFFHARALQKDNPEHFTQAYGVITAR